MKIIEMDHDFNYAIVNAGKSQKLYTGMRLQVSRDREYICKLVVTKVFKNYAVADIVANERLGFALEDDKVTVIR